MELKKLTDEAYKKYSNLPQLLRKKERGYGLIPIQVDDICFAIPLRSNLNHSQGMKTLFNKKDKAWKGLDYSKALILEQNELQQEAFKTKDPDEFDKIKLHKEKIEKEFIEYVQGYVELINSGKKISESARYKFTTLQYFHEKLRLPE